MIGLRLVVLLSLMFVMTSGTPEPQGEPEPPDGLTAVYNRLLAADNNAGDGVLEAHFNVFTFANADAASENLEMLHELGQPGRSGREAPFEEAGAPDLGDDALASQGEYENDTESWPTAKLTVVNGDVVYQAIIVGGGDELEVADAAVTFMMKATPGTINEVEGSPTEPATGGYFDVMPVGEDIDALANLNWELDDMWRPEGE